MRIGINARMFDKQQHTGIARSVIEVLKRWVEKYQEHEFFLFANNPIDLGFEIPKNWHVVVQPYILNKGLLWDEFALPKLIRKYRIDVFWGTNFSLPKRIRNVKYFVTIYDLAAFKLDGITERNNLIKLRLNARKACDRADCIIAISQATADDIHEVFGIEKKKIVVSYCGGLPSDYCIREQDPHVVNDRLVFDDDFFLFVGTIEPRKNIQTIVRAFEEYVAASASNMKLVLAGKIGWLCDDVLEGIKNSRYSDRIVLPGFISDADKAYLLSNAKALVFPSLYEGFGIPILEAFAYGLPVLTSRVSSMPEVGGNAAYYTDDPMDVQALATLMQKVVHLNTQEKNELKHAMVKQLAKFSWERNADELMELFENQ